MAPIFYFNRYTVKLHALKNGFLKSYGKKFINS